MALVSGKPPLRLLDGGSPDTWTIVDLEAVSQWKHIKEAKCPGCGRLLSQHLYNSRLGREETPDDYIPYSIDCPAEQAIAAGQDMWRTENKSLIDSHMKGSGPDPSKGLYWIARGHGEKLPEPTDKPTH